MSRYLIFALILTVGFSTGWFASNKHSDKSHVTVSNEYFEEIPEYSDESAALRTTDFLDANTESKVSLSDLLTVVDSEANTFRRHVDLYALVADLTSSQLEELANQILSGSFDGSNDYELQMLLFTRWAEVAPKQAIYWLNTNGRSDEQEILNLIIHTWAQSNSSEAALFVRGMAPGISKNGVVSLVGRELALSDSDYAVEWVRSQASGDALNFALGEVASQVALDDPKVALEILAELPPGSSMENGIVGVAHSWAKADPQAAMTWLIDSPFNPARDQAIGDVLGDWLRKDYDTAMDYIETNVDADLLGIDMIGINITSDIANHDPIAGLNWALQLDGEEPQRMATTKLFNDWAYRDIVGASQMVSRLESGSQLRSDLVDYIAKAQVERDYEQAVAWVGTLAPEDQGVALQRVVTGIAAFAPDYAATYFDKLSWQLPQQSDAVALITSAWATSDPGKAAEWTMRQDDPRARNNLYNVVEYWSATDPNTAAEWIERMPVGPNQDTAIAAFVAKNADTDPLTVLEWAESISDPHLRAKVVHDVELVLQEN